MWFIAVPGPNAVVELWQLSHAAVVGMWPATCGFGVTPANTIPVGLAAWHVTHPLAIPLWFIGVFGPNAVKLPGA